MPAKEIHAVARCETLFPSKGFVTGFYWPMGKSLIPLESRSRETNRLVGWINFPNPPPSPLDTRFPSRRCKNDDSSQWYLMMKTMMDWIESISLSPRSGELSKYSKVNFKPSRSKNSKLLKFELEFERGKIVEISKSRLERKYILIPRIFSFFLLHFYY